jgi:hypothetical protein
MIEIHESKVQNRDLMTQRFDDVVITLDRKLDGH